ncbi:hypothetical protein GCM10009706_29090 [Curtobacterium citreum]|uniref:Uncharacterized protein n=1 Tax=Curtobacterium citreum TaxID=2036 RepID=A0ABT2HKT1_9MICO|nr:hypothetical protein [Curtobacterium citreum]MCS6523888.1 hypothetical protein [Curtobacterium citreum]TQJ29000.1 hypothetical protein FB462_2907 [Curtobacterium citreum]GGL88614.1 hypothetical protein GCM10009706_29090 [Curtobacterium citreum]
MKVHVGPNSEPVDLSRPAGRDIHPTLWGLKFGDLYRADVPALGWRVEAIAYNETRVFGISDYDGVNSSGSPFEDGVGVAPMARCFHREHSMTPSVFHDRENAPYPTCFCGYRIVHDLADIASFLEEYRDAFLARLLVPAGYQATLCIAAVVGKGLASQGTWDDPDGTVRCQWTALDTDLFLDQSDAHVASLLAGSFHDVHLVEHLTDVHEESRCKGRFRLACNELSADQKET